MRTIKITEADNGYIVIVSEEDPERGEHKDSDFVFVGTGNYSGRIGKFVEAAIDIDQLDDAGIDALLEASYEGQHTYDR